MRPIDYFDKGADAFPERAAILDSHARFSYREARQASRRIARAMSANGLRGGDRVALFAPNDARVLLCMLGMWRAGGVWVPVNHRNALDANAQYMSYAGTSWLFYHSSFRAQVDSLKARVPTLRHLVCVDAADGEHPSLDQFMAQGGEENEVDWCDPHTNPDGLVGIIPTGGTTGPAKGVMMTNLAWGTMTEMGAHYWRRDDIDPVCLGTAPLTHAAGVVAMVAFAFGATNVIMPGFEAGEVLRNIERHRVTHLFLPPTAFYALLAHPDLRKHDYSSLRIFLLAASPVSAEKFRAGVEVFGPCMCQCYGQTESPMLLTWLDPATVAAAAAGVHPERLASCGKPTYAVRVAIMDDAGRILPAGERGEIVARGNLVAAGYYELPEATAEIRGHGWHHTGDVGYLDEDGYIYIVDRKKDMIITGGFNVYSAEVESCVMELPQVRECAVIGVPHDTWGEAVTAIVALREGMSLAPQAVIAHCKERLGGVKAPKTVEFAAEIARTPNGKVDKKALRKRYWAGAERNVH